MIPVDQTLFGERKGNCFAACVASILELPLVEVPNFCVMHWDSDWFQPFSDWLRDRGCMPLCFAFQAAAQRDNHLAIMKQMGNGVPWIGGGPNPDGVMHATVWVDDRMVHDPNPSRRGITRLDDALFIIAAKPMRCA